MRSPGAILILLVLFLVGAAGFAGCRGYNTLVTEDERVNQAWGDLQSQYQRRADLVPNLVSTVRGAADFEQQTLNDVVEARARATAINVTGSDLDDPETMERFFAAQQQLGGALGRLLAVTENYPQLRATEAFRDLQAQLEGTENRIAVARRDYNGAATQYNRKVRSFPTSLYAGAFGFERRATFEADAGAERAPTVQF